MYTLEVATTYNSYNVYIGNQILKQIIAQELSGINHVLIVTDLYLQYLFLNDFIAMLPKEIEIDQVILTPGETNKTWSSVEKILHTLATNQHDRHSIVISLGGGVVGDLSGFAAAIYMRGIRWLQVPTTLLAQVDASIGGKTACNFAGSKNLIGAFKQPNAVIIDALFLATLSAREFNNGIAEVVKCAFACDAKFFEWLEQHRDEIKARDPQTLLSLIRASCKIKITIVQQDEFDQHTRQHLNFGHTFGHAIEAATEYDKYLHGEAVAIGMMLATRQAISKGLINHNLETRLENLLRFFELPTELNDPSIYHKLESEMTLDKKKHGKKIRMILPCALGKVTVVDDELQLIGML